MLDIERLRTYVDDHLAGAQVALGLLERLEPDPADGLDLAQLQREIEEDRALLVAALERLGERPSGVKRAAGWIAQQLSRPKLPDDRALGRFEAFELLGLGILGKRGLWRALAALDEPLPLDRGQLASLEQRALDQWERVERARLAWAREALRDGGG
jgi:hypothetical protein